MERRSNLVLGALAFGLCVGAADPAAAQTCFGQTPTIVGAAKIKGTKGNDVILGSAFAHDQIDGGSNAIDGGLGTDKCSGQNVSIDCEILD